MATEVFYSNDLNRYYYIGESNGKNAIFSNEGIQEVYNKIEHFNVSDDFSEYMFVATDEKGDKYFIKNGVKQKIDYPMGNLKYMGKSNTSFYVKGTYINNKKMILPGDIFEVEMPTDIDGDEFVVVVGNKVTGKKYDHISDYDFSDDGQHYAFIGGQGEIYYLMHDGLEIELTGYVDNLKISPDGTKVFYDKVIYIDEDSFEWTSQGQINGVFSKKYDGKRGVMGDFSEDSSEFIFDARPPFSSDYFTRNTNVSGKYTCNKTEVLSYRSSQAKMLLNIKTIEKIDSIVSSISKNDAEKVYNRIGNLTEGLRNGQKYKNLLDYLEAELWLKVNK